MHFVGMSAISLFDENGSPVPMFFRIDLTLVSLIAVMICTLLGFWIGTRDKAFVQDKRDVIDNFITELRGKSINEIRKIQHKVLGKTLFRNMPPLIGGGVLIASGVCIMHYIGMMAMVFDGYIVWNASIVAASCLIALVAATAALWIMFRLLAMFPNLELLRFICAVVMAIAVNGMHYTGMGAATFKYEAGKASNSVGGLVDVNTAVMGALIAASLFLSFVFVITVSDLRVWYHNLSKLYYELDDFIEDALLEPSDEKRAEFLTAYLKFRDTEANDRAINQFRSANQMLSRSNHLSKGYVSVNKARSENQSIVVPTVEPSLPNNHRSSIANVEAIYNVEEDIEKGGV